jgi:hypothetical protein
LFRADLSGANLAQSSLTRADLRGVNLRGTNLTGADLSESRMTMKKAGRDTSGVRVQVWEEHEARTLNSDELLCISQVTHGQERKSLWQNMLS